MNAARASRAQQHCTLILNSHNRVDDCVSRWPRSRRQGRGRQHWLSLVPKTIDCFAIADKIEEDENRQCLRAAHQHRSQSARSALLHKQLWTVVALADAVLVVVVAVASVWSKGCPKCARGEGHQVFVLTVTYPGGRTRQFSVRRERVAEVRRWLSNYQALKEARLFASSIMTCCARNGPHQRRAGSSMIEMRRKQISFGDGLIAGEVSDLREGSGSEGRTSVVKRRHGLDRCRYKGYVGMNRWVGLGVVADNVVNIGRAMETQAAP